MLFYAEMWERFSYYGMRALLLLFMITPLAMGGLGFDQKYAAQVYGNYTMASYMVCILGGYLADNFIGARRAVLVGGLIITTGHYALAFDSVPTFYAGLILIALGTGLLKPSISTLVGGLYSHGDTRRDAGFSLFYMGINLGAFAAPLVVGWLAQSESFRVILNGWGLDPTHSWHWGFGAAGIGMTFGMIVYLRRLHWLSHIGHAPAADMPRPWGGLTLVTIGTAGLLAVMIASDYYAWINPIVYALPVVGIIWFGIVQKDEDSRRIAAILVFFVCAILFWAVFEQAGSSLTLFAEELTRNELFGRAFPSSWFQSVNSLFILLLAPLFAWLWVRLREQQPSMPMKFVWGLVFLGLSFALLVPAAKLTAEGKVSPWWLIAVYFLQTVGELCLSPVGLSAMTKLAPAKLAGLVMGIWFLGTALGNKLAGVVAAEFNAKDPQALAHFFWQQALLVPAAKLTAEGKVSPWWLIAVYFLQTIGELCLSPVGLSAMTKLAPAKLAGLVMGIWFLGTALGNKLAGVVAAEFNAKDPQALAHFFWQQALLVGGLTVLLLVLVPWVRRLTGETAR
jgi:POT family proton-dependent oligopeptide transporter